MKKVILSLLFVAGLTVMTTAQNVRLNAYAGYVFDDNVDYYGNTTNYFNGKVQGGFQYGVGVEYMAQPTVGVEVKWLHQDAHAPMKYYNDGAKTYTYDLGINYYLLDGNYYFHTGNTKIEPFLGFGIGVAVIGVKNPLNGVSQTNKTAFAWDLKGGTNIWVSDKVGIKLQASLLDASKAAGGYYYFGGVVGVSSYSYVNMLQFGLGGGLTFRLGK